MLLSSANVQLKSLQSMQTVWTFLKPLSSTPWWKCEQCILVAYGNFCNHRFMIPFIGLFFSAANGHSSHEAGGSRLYNEKDPVCLVKVGSQGNSLRKGEVQFFSHCTVCQISIFFSTGIMWQLGKHLRYWDGLSLTLRNPCNMLAYQNTLKSMTTDASILKFHKTKTSNLKNHNL